MDIGIKIGDILDAPKDLGINPKKIYYAHCISADAKLGAGVAKVLDDAFGIRDEILFYHRMEWILPFRMPSSYMTYWNANVINLVTKKKYKDKPTYEDFETALAWLRAECLARGIKTLVIPKIGCGLDGLKWTRVYMMIMKALKDVPGTCWIYMLPSKD